MNFVITNASTRAQDTTRGPEVLDSLLERSLDKGAKITKVGGACFP